MSQKIVIISDTHMGKRGALVGSPDMLRPLWQGASSLVINGDVAEIHDPRYQIKSAEQVLRLHELCEEDGVDLTLLSGNHDPYLSDIRHLKLMGDAVFVTHGDSLHPAIAPWCPSAAQVRKAHDRAMSRLEPETRDGLQARLSVSQHAANEHWENYEKSLQHSAWRELLFRPWMAFQILAYWHEIPGRAERFVKKYAQGTRFFVFGHTHRQGIWNRSGLTLINTGSFGFPGRPRGVVIEHDQLCVYPIRRHGEVFRFADEPMAKFVLPQGSTATQANAA